jgi:pimeloyl-ACP methyl ester carboxylesterase
MAAAEPQLTEIEGRSYAWRELGSGPDLVLVNGYAATGADWAPGFVAELAERFHLICPENRGMGASELGDPEAVTIESMAADVEALMDALELETAAVAGWSMGGYVSQALAERAPGRVSGLGLIGTHPGGPTYVPLDDPAAFGRLIDHTGTPREQATRLIGVLFPPGVAERIDAEFGELVAAARAALDHVALSAQERALVAWRDREPPVLAATPPTVILHGRLDALVAVGNAASLGERWGGSVEVFEECAHEVMGQEPARAAQSLTTLAP